MKLKKHRDQNPALILLLRYGSERPAEARLGSRVDCDCLQSFQGATVNQRMEAIRRFNQVQAEVLLLQTLHLVLHHPPPPLNCTRQSPEAAALY